MDASVDATMKDIRAAQAVHALVEKVTVKSRPDRNKPSCAPLFGKKRKLGEDDANGEI